MPDTTTQSASGTFKTLIHAGLLREVGALALLVAVAFAILSLVSFNAGDVAGFTYPTAPEVANLGGRFGANLVATAYLYLGVGTYLLVGLLAIWAGVIFLRKSLKNWPLKSVGLALAVTAFAGFFGGSMNGSVVMPSTGGAVGAVVYDTLQSNVGVTGTYLILAFASVVSFLFATEALFYPVVRDFFSTPSDEPELGNDVAIVFEKTDSTVAFKADGSALSVDHRPGFLGRSIASLKAFLAPKSANDESETDDAFETRSNQESHPALRLIENPDGETEDTTADSSNAGPTKVSPAALRPANAPKPVAPKRKATGKTKNADNAPPLLSLEELAKKYQNPGLDMLEESSKSDPSKTKREIEQNAQIIVDTLKHFRVDVEIIDVKRGPTITMYEIRTPPAVPIRKVVSREGELAMMLQAPKIRILAPIPGKNTIGIEVPNRNRDTVSLKEVVANDDFRAAAKKMQLPIALGLDSEGKPMIRDLAKAPHLLIAGTTGSGKSVMQNVILLSLMLARHWQDVRLVLVDPKCVELTPYQELGYLAAPVLTDMTKAVGVFEWLVEEMERRYEMFAKTRVKKLSEFNAMPLKERRQRVEERGGNPDEVPEKMPQIVAMVDELADMMMVNSDSRIDELICRIAQKARAAGMHLILATQRPSADVVTGLIKANVPARIGFKLPTSVDSRTIIGTVGAEKLLGMGDMLVDWNDGKGLSRAQSAFCDTPEIERICEAVRNQTVEDYLIDTSRPLGAGGDDGTIGGQAKHEKFDEAVMAVLTSGRASAQFLRSALRIGYNAATTLIMQMELAGILGPSRGSKEREILMTVDQWNALQGDPSDDDMDWGDDADDDEVGMAA